MQKRAGSWLIFCLVIIACLGAASCTGTPPLFHQVMLNPKGPITIGSGGTQPITASVANDTSAAGVTWTAPTHGTLTGITTTSATYNAPVVPPGASVSDTVKATSVTFPSQFATLSITVEGAPVVTTMSLPSGNWGSPYSATVSATGGVAPFSWSISSGSLTTGLSLSPSTTNSVTISGTPGAQVNSNFAIKVTDSTGAFGTQALTISIGAPLPLKVTTTSLPNGALNVAYPATTLQATGGVPPFTWALSSGALPTGLSLNPNGTITGTPTVTGTFNFSVKVTDSETPAMTSLPANLSITVGNLGPLSGNYAFEFSGFNASGAVVIAGSFTADGLGNLTAGVEDFNSTTSDSYKNQSFTGTYTLGNDDRGTLTFTSLAGSPVFAFAIDDTGSHGRMIEFDSSGVRGSGQIEKRTVSTCASNTFNGEYAFGITGQAVASPLSSAGPVVVVGSFPALPAPPPGTGQGSIGRGESDANTPGGISTSFPIVSGSYQTTSQNTRCTMNISPVSQNISTMTFSVYPVSSSEAFLVESDQVSTSAPFLTSGKLLAQPNFPFLGGAGTTFTITSVAGLTGQLLSGTTYVPDLALVSLTGSTGPTYSISILENVAGTVTASGSSGLTFINADQFGRIDSGIILPVHPVFYIVGDDEAFCIGEILNDPFFGILEPQSPTPFNITASDLNSTFMMGTSSPATSPVRDLSGVVTLANTSTTAGTINGTQDQSTSSANTAAQTVTGTYSGLSSTTGAGAVSLTAPATFSGDFLVVSPTKIIVLTTTAGDTNPVIMFLGNCASTCGED
jgi:hypothetical protein